MNFARLFELVMMTILGFSIGINGVEQWYWLIFAVILAAMFARVNMEAPDRRTQQ